MPLFQASQAPLSQPAGAHPFLLLSRQKEIARRWQTILQCLQEHRKQIVGSRAVLSLLEEVEAATDQLGELQVGRSAKLWESPPPHPTPHWCCSQVGYLDVH